MPDRRASSSSQSWRRAAWQPRPRSACVIVLRPVPWDHDSTTGIARFIIRKKARRSERVARPHPTRMTTRSASKKQRAKVGATGLGASQHKDVAHPGFGSRSGFHCAYHGRSVPIYVLHSPDQVISVVMLEEIAASTRAALHRLIHRLARMLTAKLLRGCAPAGRLPGRRLRVRAWSAPSALSHRPLCVALPHTLILSR